MRFLFRLDLILHASVGKKFGILNFATKQAWPPGLDPKGAYRLDSDASSPTVTCTFFDSTTVATNLGTEAPLNVEQIFFWVIIALSIILRAITIHGC